MEASHPSWRLNSNHVPKAIRLWALAVVAAAVLALLEDNAAANIVAAAILPLYPGQFSFTRRLGLFLITGLVLSLGAPALLLGVPIGFAIARQHLFAVASAILLTFAALASHHLQTASIVVLGEQLHLGSYAFIYIPVLSASVMAGVSIGWRGQVLLIGTGVVVIVLAQVGSGQWITVQVFSSPIFRTAVVLIPVLVACLAVHVRRDQRNPKLLPAGVCCLMGGAAIQFIPASPIASVVFDEAHGRWETVLAPFGPNDFGRSATYTYTLLGKYARRLTGNMSAFLSETDQLPSTDTAFILKMPTRAIGEEFAKRLENWVINGGRLVVVADHTDLYDTAQNLNHFIARFGAQINSDAVFDATGMPSASHTPVSGLLIGRIDAVGVPTIWQTGASLRRMPLNTIELASFGMSFSEPGDYSRPNRFGTFYPRLSLRYFRHTGIAAFSAGAGAVAIVLDSTPWSSFSIFKGEYLDLFRALINTLSLPTVIGIYGWGVVALGVAASLLAFTTHSTVVLSAGLVLGVTLGSASRIGLNAQFTPTEGREFNLRVVAGSKAKFEFLPQLVLPGERNYSRIVSSAFKYELLPRATTPGSEVPQLGTASQWLLLEPEQWQLPKRLSVVDHLSNGGSLTILFAPDQAANVEIRQWLATLGLVVRNVSALAAAEDARPGEGGFLERRGPVLLRDARAVTAALTHSLFSTREEDQFIQSYSIRPSRIPRKSGLLNLGFSADQFSDVAVGDVWEGIHPSSIGRLRERQFAAILLGKGLAPPFPEGLVVPGYDEQKSRLTSYILLADGTTVLSGQFANTPKIGVGQAIPAPIDDPVGYLLELKGRAVHFVRSSCPASAPKTECGARMMGPDMTEWMVAWVSDADANIVAIELLHERRFSGLGRTLNIIFGQ